MSVQASHILQQHILPHPNYLHYLLLIFRPLKTEHLRHIFLQYLHKVHYQLKHEQYHIVAAYYYQRLFEQLHKKEKLKRSEYSFTAPNELILPESLAFKKEDYILYLEKALYSPKGVTKIEMDLFISWTMQAIAFCKQQGKK